MREASFDVKVGGDYACFTRPELGVERVSYDVMTPSAARGLLEAIFWKPEIRWEVRELLVLNPIKTMSILRNEIDRAQGRAPFSAEDGRQQRVTLMLKDVAYVIRAVLLPGPRATEPLAKYTDQMHRRIERGQCHHTPYLGTRECGAWFERADGTEEPLPLDRDLGTMLFEIAFAESSEKEVAFHRHDGGGTRVATGQRRALFFPARLQQGVLHVPAELYREKYRLEGFDAA